MLILPSAADSALWGQGLPGGPQEAVDLSEKDDDMETTPARVPPPRLASLGRLPAPARGCGRCAGL